MKARTAEQRLAELDLEEAIIREGYMYGAGPIQALIIVERLNEIVTEREVITNLLAQTHQSADSASPA